MFEAYTPDADRQQPLGAQAYHRAEGLLKTHTTVSEKSRSPRGLKPHRLKDQRNGGRRAYMFDRDLGRQGYTAASVPHGVAPLPLNEQIALPRAAVSRGNGKGVERSEEH